MQAKLRITGNAVTVLLAAVLAACQISGLPYAGDRCHGGRASRLAREGDHAGGSAPVKPPRRTPRRGGKSLWLAAAGEWLHGSEARRSRSRDRQSHAAARRRRCARTVATRRRDCARARGQRACGRNPGGNLRRRRGDARDPRARAVREPARGGRRGSLMARDPGSSPGSAERQANQKMIVDGIQSSVLRGADARAPDGRGSRARGLARRLGRILADQRSGALGASAGCRPGTSTTRTIRRANRSGRGAGERPRRPASGRARSPLLLPLSGRSAAAGSAVRDSFLGAYLRDDGGTNTARKSASHDVAERDAPSAYLQALADGSGLWSSARSHARKSRALATLADGRATTPRAQFPAGQRAGAGSLLPVRAVARRRGADHRERIAADGRRSGVDARARNPTGAGAFSQPSPTSSRRPAGRLSTRRTTCRPPRISTTSCGGSCARPASAAAIRGPTRGSSSSPRQPVHGRLIRTQLRFSYASALPMYATSDIYDPAGPGNAWTWTASSSRTCQWVLDPQGTSGAGARDRGSRVPGRGGQLGRLYAFRLRRVPPGQRSATHAQRQPGPAVSGRPAVSRWTRKAACGASSDLGAGGERARRVPGLRRCRRRRREHQRRTSNSAARPRPPRRRRAASAIAILTANFRAKGRRTRPRRDGRHGARHHRGPLPPPPTASAARASITHGKRRRIISAARALLATNPPLAKLPARFDVVEVGGPTERALWRTS